MNERRNRIPLFVVLLDAVGVVLLAAGILPLSGVDFGFPVLRQTAPFFVAFGLLLMIPLLVVVVRKAGVRK